MRKTLTQALLAAFCATLAAYPLEGGGVMLINLRNGMMSGKRTPTAKDYVQDGLVAMWDGIENARRGVHDANATVWKNLIANSVYPDFDIKSGGTWGDNCLQFNGFAAQSQTAWPSFYNIELVYRLDSGYVDFAPNFSSSMRWYQWDSSGAIFSSGTNRKAYQYDDFGYGNAMSLSMQYGGGDIDVLYIDGVQKPQTGTRTQRTSAPAKTCIGMRNGISSSYNTGVGVVYRIAIYSRALAADEITANYAIDKARFNLPQTKAEP